MRPGIKRHLPGHQASGFTFIELLFVLIVLGILAAIAVPSYMRFVQRARESAVMDYLWKMGKAEEFFRINGVDLSYTGDFNELQATGIVPSGAGAASRVQNEYRIDLSAGTDGSGEPVWSASASPAVSGGTGNHYFIDQTGVMRKSSTGPADASSPRFTP